MTLAVVCRREFASLWHSNDNVAPIAGPAWEFLLPLLRELLNKIIIIILIIININNNNKKKNEKEGQKIKNINIKTWREKLEEYGGLGNWSSTGSQFAALWVGKQKVGCMAWEAWCYHKNGTIVENSLVRHS